jgi:tetratricopeptide (TPR) repeat protein
VSAKAAATPPAAEPLVLLDDEDTRIELHRFGPQPAAVLTLTFDPLLYLWPRPAFALDFVRRLGSDVIAVRRKHEHFYQPLSRQAFLAAVRPALRGYARVLAYGSSLGAYAALYYGRDLDALLLAPSPRVSVHPVHGHPAWQRQVGWQHDVLIPAATPPPARAWIAYDPRDLQDRRYVEEELLPQFPGAQVLRVPYSGHPTTQFLGDVGHLQALVKAALADQPLPTLARRALRSRSASYWQVLGDHAMRRERPALAQTLLQRSLALRPRNPVALRTHGELALGQGDEIAAAASLRAALELDPSDKLARHLLARCGAAAMAEAAPPSATGAAPAPLPLHASQARPAPAPCPPAQPDPTTTGRLPLPATAAGPPSRRWTRWLRRLQDLWRRRR